MEKEAKTKIKLTIITALVGLFLFLEGLGITNFSRHEKNAPGAILILVGLIFILAGIMITFGKKTKLNHFLASLLAAIMGIIFAWISLYGDAANFSGNGMLVPYISKLPQDRIIFCLGSLLCFLVSAYAFRLFLKNKTPDKRL